MTESSCEKAMLKKCFSIQWSSQSLTLRYSSFISGDMFVQLAFVHIHEFIYILCWTLEVHSIQSDLRLQLLQFCSFIINVMFEWEWRWFDLHSKSPLWNGDESAQCTFRTWLASDSNDMVNSINWMLFKENFKNPSNLKSVCCMLQTDPNDRLNKICHRQKFIWTSSSRNQIDLVAIHIQALFSSIRSMLSIVTSGDLTKWWMKCVWIQGYNNKAIDLIAKIRRRKKKKSHTRSSIQWNDNKTIIIMANHQIERFPIKSFHDEFNRLD